MGNKATAPKSTRTQSTSNTQSKPNGRQDTLQHAFAEWLCAEYVQDERGADSDEKRSNEADRCAIRKAKNARQACYACGLVTHNELQDAAFGFIDTARVQGKLACCLHDGNNHHFYKEV